MKRILIIFISLIFYLNIATEAGAFWIWSPKTKKLINPKYAGKDTPEEQFKWAMKFYEEKDYKRSAEEFDILVAQFNDSDLAPEAQYYVGRSHEDAGKYYPAFVAYQKVIDIYPFTKRINEIIEREYNLGSELYIKHTGKLMGKELMTDLDRAIEIFDRIRENAPFGEDADKAQFMIGKCYKKAEQYSAAVGAFQKLIDEYPKSELVEKATYEVAQCTYMATLKPDYDQELTDDAIAEFKRLAEEEEGFASSEGAKESISLLENRKAESLYRTAQFYEKQKHYKSAAIYYEEILKQYPHSALGKSAQNALEKVGKFLKKEENKTPEAPKKAAEKKKWIFF